MIKHSLDEFPEFRPHPLLRGGHRQTLWSAVFKGPVATYQGRKHLVPIDAQEKLVLHDDTPANWNSCGTSVLLLHGLGGSYASSYMVRLTDKLTRRGVRVFRMDMRGCGAGNRLAISPGHAGRSEDVHACVETIRKLCPQSPLRVVGFSLGGNLLLKMLGEKLRLTGQIDQALAVSPPIDLRACSENIRKFRFYDYAFVLSLCMQIRQRRRVLPELRTIKLVPPPRSIREFDDRITAPLSGFRDALDYYAKTSAAPHLSNVEVPTTIILAEDDPLIPISMFERPDISSQIRIHRTRFGGHLGYFGSASGDPDRYWLDWRVVDWACS